MSDEQYDLEIKRIDKIYDKWQDILGLRYHAVSLAWDRERKIDDPDVAADTWTSWQYRLVHIKFYLPACIDNNDKQIEHIVLHEICHILIGPLAQNIDDDQRQNMELATENVARAIEDAYAAGQKDFK